MNISNLRPIELPPQLLTDKATVATPGENSPASFASVFGELLQSTEAEQDQVGTEVERILSGDSSNFHEVSLAVARADLSFRFMMQIRDQLIGTYREIMRMQV